MSFIGDIERLLAELWPFRLPLAIGFIISVALIGFVVWRRGWYRIALDHPRSSVAVTAVVLAIGLPLTWALASPLFIRTELNEAPPVVALSTSTSTSTASAEGTLLAGEFVGADSFHFGEGNAEIIEAEPGRYSLSLTDFSVLNGPDLFVYISPDPDTWTPEAINLGALKATDGSFSYAIPDDVDPADIGSAVIWCRAFSVLFASATLQPANT